MDQVHKIFSGLEIIIGRGLLLKLSKVSLGLIICVSLLVGGLAGAYGDSIYNRHNEEKQERVEVKAKDSSENESKEEEVSSVSESDTEVDQESQATLNTDSETSESITLKATNQPFNVQTGTFVGYHDIHEFWNNYSGHSVINYLEQKCGYSEEQAMAYVSNYYSQGLDKFMGSYDIQTYNEYAKQHGGATVDQLENN